MTDDTGSAPAPAPQPAPAPAPAPAPQPAAWHASFDDETRGWLENRGLHQKQQNEALTALVSTARNAEKKFGVPADRLLQLPAVLEAEGALDPIYDRLGRPKTPEEYRLAAPDANDAIGAKFANDMATTFHKAGLSAQQAQAVFNQIDSFVTGVYETETTSSESRRNAEMAALQAEWGDLFAVNKIWAQEAVKAIGATEEEINALATALDSDAKVVRFFAKLGQKRGGEAPFVSSNNPAIKYAATTPEAAKSRILELKQDPVLGAQLREAMQKGHDEAPIMKEYRALTSVASRA
jgi:hypothetical protein